MPSVTISNNGSTFDTKRTPIRMYPIMVSDAAFSITIDGQYYSSVLFAGRHKIVLRPPNDRANIVVTTFDGTFPSIIRFGKQPTTK
uniref:Uncharacterized protein n=1 Tax=Clandestinovirus TaxID=2831644 RepID=A0A8F8KKY2_9VIRU|nr:hypothetical protein KOM_12_314 [Clandestinovirus]